MGGGGCDAGTKYVVGQRTSHLFLVLGHVTLSGKFLFYIVYSTLKVFRWYIHFAYGCLVASFKK